MFKILMLSLRLSSLIARRVFSRNIAVFSKFAMSEVVEATALIVKPFGGLGFFYRLNVAPGLWSRLDSLSNSISFLTWQNRKVRLKNI